MDVNTFHWTGLLNTKVARAARWVLLSGVVGLAGCEGLTFSWLTTAHRSSIPTKTDDVDPEGDSLILRTNGLVPDKAPKGGLSPELAARLAQARELFRKQEYDKAEDIFFEIADKDKNPPAAIQEATYYRAECLRLQGHYPKAADLYAGLLNKFPSTPYREQCVQHMFNIANRWLDDTRAEMREEQEKQAGKRWFVWPRYISFEDSKPFLDREGRAIEKLEQVRLHDINGPLADQALFLCGVVKMYNENYRDADQYFTSIYARHPESPLAPKAIELGIQCKHLSTGGSDYDGRKTAEARKMVNVALASYPQLANNKEMRAFLEEQKASIDVQQAEKEFKMAEFYRRTGHPASAYFYYKLVERRYPGTKYAQMAVERWNELREKLEKENGGVPEPDAAARTAPPQAQALPKPSWTQPPPQINQKPEPLPSPQR
jgi:outer membrane protein assembly factor BamD (BamD/ComL family)